MALFRFPAREKLKSTKHIREIFTSGQQKKCYPLKVLYRFLPPEDGQPACQAAFSVPKRSFRLATRRNRCRRLLRESFRLQKSALVQELEEHGQRLQLLFILMGSEEPEFAVLRKAMGKCLRTLQDQALDDFLLKNSTASA